ncbi:MAG: LamG-like jellyroll fold domain-containing protein [Chitinophagales bacterium]
MRNIFTTLFTLCFLTNLFAQPGNALNFDGVDDRINAPLPAVFSDIPNNDITIEAWVNPSGSAFQRIVFAEPSTTNFMSMGTSTGNVIYFYVIKNGTTYSLGTTTTIPQNSWTHVACTWKASTNTINCYFNGILQPSVAGGSSSNGTAGLLSIGARPDGAQFFNGALDDIRIWSEARTACQLQANMNANLTGSEPNLQAFYPFNQGTAGGTNSGVTTLTDNAGNSDGTLINFSLTGNSSNWVASGANLNVQGLQVASRVVTDTTICYGSGYTLPDGSLLNHVIAPVKDTIRSLTAAGCDSFTITNINVGLCGTNNALDFDGANDVVNTSLPAVFNNIPGNDITIEAWVNPAGSAFQRIVFAEPSTTNFMSMGTSTGNVIYFYVIKNGTTYSLGTTTTIPQNSWTHVACTWEASTNTVKCYFNGILQPSVNGGASSTGTAGMLSIGARPGGAQYFSGKLDEIRIWSEARTACELQANYRTALNGTETNLAAYYTFDHGVAGGNNTGVTTLVDFAGGNNGTLNGFTLNGGASNWVTSGAVRNTLGLQDADTTLQNVFVCKGEDYTFPDATSATNITAQLIHASHLINGNGCDSVVVTTVNVNPTYNQTTSATICSGGSYTFADGTTQSNITAQVVYTSHLQTINGCDSIIVTTVNVNPTYNQTTSATICSGGSYTFADGTTQSNITSQVVYTSHLQTINGCDSVIVTTVNVNPTYNQTTSATICSGGSYTFADGTTQSNITAQVVYTSHLQTINGCDSVIVTTVNVNPTYNQANSATICSGSSYTFADGTAQSNITAQVVYTSHLQTVNGCDSIIVTTVNVNPTYNQTTSATICSGGSYTFADGTTQSNITAQVVYTSHLQTVNGCDSIIVTTVDVNPTYNQTTSATICSGGSYTFADGTTQNNITAQTVYTSTLQTVNGCDSIIVTTVNVNPTYSQTTSATICSGGSYTFADGTTQSNITAQVVYTSHLQTINGCDSVIVTTVDVATVNTTVVQNNDTLTATGDSFQWLTCTGNGYTVIGGAISATYIASSNGSYAVVVTSNNCSDTSQCYQVIKNDIAGTDITARLKLYPNPTTGRFVIETTGLTNAIKIEVLDMDGRLVSIHQHYNSNTAEEFIQAAAGIYFVKVTTTDGTAIFKVVKE